MHQRILSFDLLNILACFSVICLHHNGLVHVYDGSNAWFGALVVEVMFYFAVPVFFMLSGATLMRYSDRYDTKTFFRKRFQRTLVPWLVWSGICGGGYYVLSRDFSTLNPVGVINCLLNSTYESVYWFFIPLFCLYLLMPLLAKAKDDIRLVKYLAFIFFLISGCYGFYYKITGSTPNGFLSSGIFFPLMYAMIGYVFNYQKLSRPQYICLSIISVACLVLRYFVTAHLSAEIGATDKTLFGYGLLTAVFPSVWVFYTVKNFNISVNDKLAQIIVELSSCSLGIYLIHRLVMRIEMRVFDMTNDMALWRIPMTLVTYATCLLIVWLVKKHKLGRLIFP